MDQAKKKNIIIVCCLAAVLVAALIYSFRGVSTSAAPQGQSTQQQTEIQVQAAPEEEAVQPSQTLPVTAMNEAVSRDPFVPQILPAATGSATVGRNGGPVIRITTSGPSLSAIPPFLFGGGEPVVRNSGSQPRRPTVSEPAVDPARELKLTGIIEGSINLAIIRGSDNTRYIVREGQRIDGKYTVGRISKQSGVSVRYLDRESVLHLGGNG